MKKGGALILIGVILFAALAEEASARKLLPRVAAAQQQIIRPSGKEPTGSRGVGVQVRLRTDRLGIFFTLTNLAKARAVSYELSYQTEGMGQGARGSINLATEEGKTKELLFGTCSAGVCRFHQGIKKARLVVTTTLPNGTKVVKPFRLKV